MARRRKIFDPMEAGRFISDHLFYEVAMLRFGLATLKRPTSPFVICSAYECVALHFRNIEEFLQNKADIAASDCAPGYKWRKHDELGNSTVLLNAHVFHMTDDRLDESRRLTLKHSELFSRVAEAELQRFLTMVSEPVLSGIDSRLLSLNPETISISVDNALTSTNAIQFAFTAASTADSSI